MKNFALFAVLLFSLTSCTENKSVGDQIGVVTKFAQDGIIWKSYEGHLNVTQTGMNSSTGFDFSVDNDKEGNDDIQRCIKTLDSTSTNGWKVKIMYHEVFMLNWFSNRGKTDHFVSDVIVLDRNMSTLFGSGNAEALKSQYTGRVVDTIYVVIDRSK